MKQHKKKKKKRKCYIHGIVYAVICLLKNQIKK